MKTQGDCFELDRIAFIGRTYDEYVRMFDLDEEMLGRGHVLDCGAGPSSFTVEACSRGSAVTACDVLYGEYWEALSKQGTLDIALVHKRAGEVPHLFQWDYYRDRDELVSHRKRALEHFLADYPRGHREGRYVHAELPCLPFPDGAFSLVLSSHLLFLYGDRLSTAFHISALREMVRVCSGEVRVYPLQGIDARPYPQLEEVVSTLQRDGISAEIVEVPFAFQRGAKQMVRVRRVSTED